MLVLVLVPHRPAYQEKRTCLERDYAQLVARQQVWGMLKFVSLLPCSRGTSLFSHTHAPTHSLGAGGCPERNLCVCIRDGNG